MNKIKTMPSKIAINPNIAGSDGDGTSHSRDSKTIEDKLYFAPEPPNRLIYEKGASLAFNLIISFFLLTIMARGNSLPSVMFAVFCISTCAIVTEAGKIAIRLFHNSPLNARLPAAFVVGFTVISLPMMILTYKFNISALMSLILCSLAVIGSSLFIARTANTAIPLNDWRDTFAVLFIVITIALLAKIPFASYETLRETGSFPIWSDYFIHGITIATFGSPFATGGDMEVAGVSRTFYHYAPFVIPAAFQTVSGLSGLELSTSLLLPLGLIISALGIYSFATELGGRASGSVTVILIICIPAYSLLIQSGWFEFYWLFLTAPGSGYAIGVSAVVCASTAVYLEKRDKGILYLALLMLASLVVIRVHMFLLLAPAIIAALVVQYQPARLKLMSVATAGVITAIFLTLQFSDSIHDTWQEYTATKNYLNIVASTLYFYRIHLAIPAALPYGLTMFFQVAAILGAALGLYLALYPPLLWIHLRRNRFKAADAIPLFLVLFFILLIIFAPIAANGDSSEYKHRHFLLLYVLFSIYTIYYGISFASSRKSRFNDTILLGSGLIVLIITATIFTYRGSNPARPDIERMPWTADFHDQRITPGILEISDYLRTHAKDGDVLTMELKSVSSIGPKTQIVQIISLTGIPAFVARAELKMLGSRCAQEIVKNRLSILNEFTLIEEWPTARKYLQTNGIRWYISTAGENPKWDSGSKEAVFTSNGMSVYDAGTVPGRVSKDNKC